MAYMLQYSSLENSMDRGVWWAHVARSQTQLNAALQQILNEDYNAARNTLAAVANPNGTTAYLQAVIAARTNDKDGVYSNLKVAIEKDAALKAKAAKDIEFAKFIDDAEFAAIIK